MSDLFHVRPAVFENTEFTFNNGIAQIVREMGFAGAFTEGAGRILWGGAPTMSTAAGTLRRSCFRNVSLSDDIAFRFGNRSWERYPLTADKYAGWVAASPGDVATVFIDYETFGEHLWKETGIFDFLRFLPGEFAAKGVMSVLPSQAIANRKPPGRSMSARLSRGQISRKTRRHGWETTAS